MRKGIIYVYFNRAKYEKEGIEKYYIGQTIGTMEQRAGKNGRNYGCTDPNCNSKFARSIRKWGWDAFEGRVLEEVYEEDLDELEKFYIEQFDSFKNGYNSTLGGEGTRGLNPYANKTEEEMKEIKEKISKSSSKASKKRYEDPKERERQSKAIKTSWENPERKKIQSEKLSGENNGTSKYHKVIINNKTIIGRYLDETINISKQYIDNINRNWFKKSKGIPKKFKNIVSIEEISKEDYYILLQNKNIISYVNVCK